MEPIIMENTEVSGTHIPETEVQTQTRQKREKIPVPVYVQLLKGGGGEQSGLDKMLATFRKNAGKWIFRTIDTVKTDEDAYIGSALYEPDENGHVKTSVFYKDAHLPFGDDLQRFKNRAPSATFEELLEMCENRGIEIYEVESRDTLIEKITMYEIDRKADIEERQVEKYYSEYFCVTSDVALRPGTPGEKLIGKNRLILNSANYGEPDFFAKMDFKMRKLPSETDAQEYKALPRPPRIVRGQKCTDIACILATKGKIGPEVKCWFVCSPQLMRAWTMIMFREHESLKKLASTEEELRKKIFSGNHTITNTYLGWMLSCQQNNLLSDFDEIKKRFWSLRSEYASRAWMHIYSALVLMLRYQECPGNTNVPNKLDDGPFMKTWNLPEDWLEALFAKYGIEVIPDPAYRVLNVPVYPATFIPKGTRSLLDTNEGEQAAYGWGDFVVQEQ